MNYLDPLHQLLAYPAFRGLLYLSVAAILVLGGFIIALMALHFLFTLGKHSPIYKKRQPVDGWSKRFYPASILLLAAVAGLGWWVVYLLAL